PRPRRPGRRPAILVGAHYDVEARPRGFVGANDGAAGTAAVVAIARALAASPSKSTNLTSRPPATGSTDHFREGLRGSRAYARRYADEVGEMILLDYVGARGLRLPREGTSDRELWARLRASAGRVGVAEAFPDETGAYVYDDHTPFLEAGVPAINLIDWGYPWRDTLADDMSKVSLRSLDVAGEAVVGLVDELRRR
ncbi:MAG: M28 family peptidase, partial [Solirubrobacterales bacterium]